MTVVTRFAPSPTGYLHIGGARTALFNWLFAKHHGGKYLLRIEDTDRARSTEPAIAAILDGLSWLGLPWDGEVTYQFSRAARHAEVALEMLAKGHAYHCYASPQELDEMRAAQKAAGKPMRYDGRWRDRDPKDAPAGVKPVVRLKAPQSGQTVIKDAVQGEVTVENAQLDDMILLRADGTPTYMLAVVVDDHDMGVTHVIRGDDHLNNAFRQLQIIRAMGWAEPVYAHIPLIHGPDGAKLSKRHGALGVDAYRDMGFLPAALRNYLLRLGWGHGDDEIIPTAQAIEWFDLAGVGRSASRFDMAKLTNLNAHYLRETPDADLLPLVLPRIEEKLGTVDAAGRERIVRGLSGVKQRARTLIELADSLAFYARAGAPPISDDKARALLTPDARAVMAKLAPALESQASDWSEKALEEAVREFAEANGLKLGQVAQPLRVALTGSTASPGIFEVLAVLGPAESKVRLLAAAA
ncbi:glutamate--tRNA ligase [Reyranella sp.]|jgi:glutamyl-tRNA synthetase|uniref:glutamate--tRNA ligase n=1 Tax=Reyranella sp. TaxID=1929291 RepID=UPI000BDA2D7C|nr:glutamate--tRNA ligase [Reyranella sp.]OYY45902.1 MAG: glutamate--tRNA ligase [Rhodospirillales bacterium 35-66-84]OYZ96283.1 MAG: glutamate--tRNA ligase [Rhodospirillales bacterium 24-66-33]OZB28555.1 MAG: glutamate--tRNA ligase [Rhodospirillales bacterium 39-66-50]HQS14227.1 glutamate--tRNA ligase [Reyranella sp.]HQT11223.1 glutamate--tRNA ligase [Reyranella sp.]